MKKLYLDGVLFSFGFSAYSLIELAWRRYTHVTMGVAGGLCFLILYKIFKRFKGLGLIKKCLIGSLIITAVEYVFGCIFNLWLGLGIWDYSSLPLNLSGQICPLYSLLWAILCVPIVFLVPIFGKMECKIKSGR